MVAVAVVEGERMTVAVKRSAEVVLTVTRRYTADGDVRAEFDGLAAETVIGVIVVQTVAENLPARRVVNRVGIAVLGEVGGFRNFAERSRIPFY